MAIVSTQSTTETDTERKPSGMCMATGARSIVFSTWVTNLNWAGFGQGTRKREEMVRTPRLEATLDTPPLYRVSQLVAIIYAPGDIQVLTAAYARTILAP